MEPLELEGTRLAERQDKVAAAPAKGCGEPDVLDLRGLKCPLPALRTRKALSGLPPGARATVLADDPLARLDIAHLCRTENHELLAVEALGGSGWRFVIRRAGDPRNRASTG